MAKTSKTDQRNFVVMAKGKTCQTGEIVLQAVKKLMKNTGWTAKTIIQFIKMEYAVNDPALSSKVCRTLKRGVKLGLLRVHNGRYRLNVRPGLISAVKPRYQHGARQLCCRLMEPPLRLRSRTSFKSKKTNRK